MTTGSIFTVTATIDASVDDDLSNAVFIDGKRVVGIYKPTTTSTALTFEAGLTEDGTFYPVDTGSGAYSITVATGVEYYVVNPANLDGAKWLKIATGSNEAADREFIIAMRDL